MALTQSARLPGPSWEEEVVPALRKRLETESRTLSRRLSAISLSSVEEATNAAYSVHKAQSPPASTSSHQSYNSGGHSRPHPTNRTKTTPPNGSANSASKPTAPSYRARTYSTPYGSNLPNGHVNGNGRPKFTTGKPSDPARPMDVKPTRIPKPYANGYGHNSPIVTTAEPPKLQSSSSTRSTIDLPRANGRHILNEAPPFPTEAAMEAEDPPRASMESEERPFEHWYRGEVSRNGGVGELRVGRRQEMLDIANYGHLIGNKKPKPSPKDSPAATENNDPLRHARKRADSIAGMTKMERERGSLYLDDEPADDVGRVMDENPLTDLDGEGESDVHSIAGSYYNDAGGGGAYAYIPGADDVQSQSHASDHSGWTPVAGAYESNRSTTPTPLQPGIGRGPPPTRIPGPSSRRSSDSRSTVSPSLQQRAGSEPPPQQTGSPSMSGRQQQAVPASTSTLSTPPSRQQQQRGASPASMKSKTPKSRTPAKPKPAAAKKEDKRRSVAAYPMLDDGDEDMADAIPTWTQPVRGAWDDVVIPVVARKHGLDTHYETADGSPQPKKVDTRVAPAPGTFGFDHSKYRPPRGDTNDQFIPMDEFGRPAEDEHQDGARSEEEDGAQYATMPPQQGVPIRTGIPKQPPSPAPFAHYTAPGPPIRVGQMKDEEAQQQHLEKEEEEKNAGCCKCCVVM